MKKYTKQILVIAVFALAVRVAYLLWLRSSVGLEQFSDFKYLYRLAESLANGDGFTLDGVRIWNQSLGYPLFLSIFFRVFGTSVRLALILNTVLGVVTCLLIYLLTHLLYPPPASDPESQSSYPSSPFIVYIPALLAAVYPDLILYTGLCASENLMIPLTLAMGCCAVYFWKRAWLGGCLVGLFAALAATSKALMIFTVPALVLYWMITHRRWFVMTACAGAAAVVLLAPWTIHNYRQCGHIVPFAAVSGETFLDGNNSNAKGVPSGTTTLPEIEASGLHPVEKDRLKMQHAVTFIKDNPAKYAKLLAMKSVRMAIPARDFVFEANGQKRFPGGSIGFRWLPTLFNLFLYAGIFLSLLLPLLRFSVHRLSAKAVAADDSSLAISPSWWFTLLITAMMVVIQFIFFAYSRYRLPFLCVLMPSVAYGWGMLPGYVRVCRK